ncbi:glycoside hydrolase family 172 protein [Paenibacillus glycanilyticus]|uniref:glycoside hydrolase family 172 protein n=1 Tax=Paenibacillus glycanilyticus TaxID=126569 RepID=UPI001910B185|nr:glycoside hydrolase family 172 protein [Paenibacillus glycanilyticus]
MHELYLRREGTSHRDSSWDRTGGNRDFLEIKAGTTAVISDIEGSGIIKHIWMTIGARDKYAFRKVLIRMYWDGEAEPSVDSPVGDFFGVGHGVASHYVSMPLNMITTQGVVENKAAMNCFFEMPFRQSARIEIVNECENDMVLYFYVDYVKQPVSEDSFYFHASWRRENPTKGTADLDQLKAEQDRQHKPNYAQDDKVSEMKNLTGDENYVLLDAEGEGHYVGCNLSIDHINPVPGFSWPGEGDDMFFIDGQPWPPRLHGTGTEDYFCAAWGYPSGQYYAPYHGLSLYAPIRENGDAWKESNTISFNDYSGKMTQYRYHITDPIIFRKSIRFSIEHGHANCQANDYSSVAYWYQREPHKAFPEMLPVELRLPIAEKDSARRFYRTF